MTRLADPPVVETSAVTGAPAGLPLFAFPTDPVFRLTVERYHEMVRVGVLTSDDPVELLEGVLVFKMPKNPPHETTIGNLQDLLPKLLPEGWLLRLQAPVTLDDGEPEPDAAIVRGRRADYAGRHPAPADTAAVIEVADATLARDRGVKLRSYARAGIAHYLILNLEAREIECYTNPDPVAATYLNRLDIASGASVTITLPAGPAITLRVDDVL